MDKDYVKTSQDPASAQAEEMHKHRLEALARNIKSHTRLRGGIDTSSAQKTVRDNAGIAPHCIL
ncbi:hypothetical protein D7217_05035 [Legionella pneumophila]|nr:hypothetical protein D7217_05035 [Legionella pneumophila]HAT9855063.1 hypothetical protein [Legionella pneumophila subsp. pneumophila]HAT1774623.1 hypothetical protein [Legionella pneumophila]HAT1777805.1 hypothetical protein [Legionella pneumophila]HAT2018264.1 hypothetical protein [Legionella pneumophila]